MPHEPPLSHPTGDRADALLTVTSDAVQGGLNAAWVHAAGELDMSTVPALERELQDRGRSTSLIVLDLRDLTFMDTSGLHLILDETVRARQAGRRLVLLRGRPNVDMLFTLTGTADDAEFVDPASLSLPAQAPVELVPQGRAS